MKTKHKQKTQIIKYCREMLTEAERKAERESIQKIEAYKKHEKHIYRRIEKERENAAKRDVATNHDDLETELDQLIKELYSQLLEIEINLQEALKLALKSFYTKVNSVIDVMKELTSAYIGEVGVEVQQFNEKFKEATILEKDKFQIRVDEVDIEELTKEYESNQALLDVLTEYDNETLITHLDGFKEASEGKIANYESTIISAIT